jgi:hypothetical protein
MIVNVHAVYKFLSFESYNFDFRGGREKCRILESVIKGTYFLEQMQIVYFFMNEFSVKENCGHLLAQMAKMAWKRECIGNSEEKEMAPISSRKDVTARIK